MIDPILRMSDVVEVTCLSRATINRRRATGQFPKPLKLGKQNIGWRQSEIEDWLASLPRAEE